MQSSVRLAMATLAAVLAAVAILGASLVGFHWPEAEGQTTTALAVDANPAGNSADSVGQIDYCIEVSLDDDTADIDIVLRNVEDLLGFEFYLEYDRSIVEIQDADLKGQFLDSAAGSRVVDVSEPLPDPDHLHLFGAADIGKNALDSGSGVLARITLTLKDVGVSPLEIAREDVDKDGDLDLGPRLIGSEGTFIGDSDHDEFLDEEPTHGQIAVDTDCPPPPPSPTVPPDPEDQLTPKPTGSPSLQDPTPEPDSTPVSGETVLLLPPVPPEISDTVSSPGRSASDGADTGTNDDASDNISANGEDGSGGSGGSSSASGSSSSSSGLGLPLWLVIIIASAMLGSGGLALIHSRMTRR